MEIREGQFWTRKCSGFLWEVEAVNPNGILALRTGTDPVEHESFTREDFLERFVHDG